MRRKEKFKYLLIVCLRNEFGGEFMQKRPVKKLLEENAEGHEEQEIDTSSSSKDLDTEEEDEDEDEDDW